jgi:CRISPR-associated endonuclease Csn1
MPVYLGLDIGSNSVGSAWIDTTDRSITPGVSIFPAGVDESDDKRGEPRNAKRRMARRTRITLARRAERKRLLRLQLIEARLLPREAAEFKILLENTDPWELRRKGLDGQLTPHEFGRVLLHLAQHRGALGLKIADPDESEPDGDAEDGKVKAAIGEVRAKMLRRKARSFGEYIALVRAERVTPITSEDRRAVHARKGPREYRDAVRNKAGSYEHCADRDMVRDEFQKLWHKQVELGGDTARLLTNQLCTALDDESGDSLWVHKGLLFGQRRQSWDLGTLGRCVLEPTERCVPHADMYASRYLVVETVNNLKIIERGKEARPLTPQERQKIKDYLSGPLGIEKGRRKKGDTEPPKDKPKTTVSVTDLRNLMGWGRASKTSPFRLNIESDEERTINTDWFSREIIHGAVTPAKWAEMPPSVREGLNRAILKFDPDRDADAAKIRNGAMSWGGLDEAQADALVGAWKKRPRVDAKRLNMSRRAVRNLLTLMDRAEPWPDTSQPRCPRWLTQIEARKLIAEDADYKDATTGGPLDLQARMRYATGAKGATARDRYYMQKHLLLKNGKPVFGPDGLPLAEPPPAPLINNPVVRKAIHEVRRHLVEYMTTFGRKPDAIYIELAREARMGKMAADKLLFRNRLRNRIRNDIVAAFDLDTLSSTQQRAAVDRVILAVQQGGVCPLCGNQAVPTEITPRMAAFGAGCDVAHIIPKACGGHNGLGNIVLGHTKCNRDMGRRTPRQFWEATIKGGFEEGMRYVEGIYQDVDRPKPSEVKNASGNALWSCYFAGRPSRFGPTFDELKIEQFKKDISDIQEMTPRQSAATSYAARQVMTYLADALYGGKGLPERSTGADTDDRERRIFATDGLWTSRLRWEWGLRFDPHQSRAKGLTDQQEHHRKEKDRGDHRHHAIDAVVIALCSAQVQRAWDDREKCADRDGMNTADEVAMKNYRRRNPLPVPPPFGSQEEFREAVRLAVFGEVAVERPICHRPVKRKLIGALHEETLLGPVLDNTGRLTQNFTAQKSVLALDPNHLRMPRLETSQEAIERLAHRRLRQADGDERAARKWARQVVLSAGYKPAIIDPPPEKSGIVRDIALRARLRECLTNAGLDPDDFSANQVKKVVESGGLRQASGIPIRSVVLLRTMKDPAIVSRWASEHATGKRCRVYDATTGTGDAAAARAYVGGNNHHIEIRAAKSKKGEETWSGEIVTAFEVAQRKLAKLRAFRKAGIPKPDAFRKLLRAERAKLTPTLRAIEAAHPLVDRCDNDAKGGKFIMSLCEGEMLLMKHKVGGEVGYFVVAKLDKPQSIVLVPHWDARAAGERKDSEGTKVPDSKRDQFAATPGDLKSLAPPGRAHAIKVCVSPIGAVTEVCD